jgi:hypothetical protein
MTKTLLVFAVASIFIRTAIAAPAAATYPVTWFCDNPPVTDSESCIESGLTLYKRVGCKQAPDQEPNCMQHGGMWICRALTLDCSSVLAANPNKDCPQGWSKSQLGASNKLIRPQQSALCKLNSSPPPVKKP